MRISAPRTAAHRARTQAGFTIAELTMTLAVGMLVLAGIITSYLVGMRFMEFTRPKLLASDYVRGTLGRLITDVRSADSVTVGQGAAGTFTPTTDGALQQGNAIKVIPTANTNSYVLYFRDAADRTLKRAVNGARPGEVVATSVSNAVVFTGETFNGTILTNHQAYRVVGVQLQIQQTNYLTRIGGKQFYDSYEVRTKITKRTLK